MCLLPYAVRKPVSPPSVPCIRAPSLRALQELQQQNARLLVVNRQLSQEAEATRAEAEAAIRAEYEAGLQEVRGRGRGCRRGGFWEGCSGTAGCEGHAVQMQRLGLRCVVRWVNVRLPARPRRQQVPCLFMSIPTGPRLLGWHSW